MKSGDALIRLARFKVEGLQKQMSDLDEARLSLEGQFDRLQSSVPEEQVAATASREGFVAYGSYAQAAIQRKANLRASLADVEERANKLRAELEDAFRELKKFELIEERRAIKERAARAKREQTAIDECASRAAG